MSIVIERFTHKGLTIKIKHDSMVESPAEMDLQWKVYSFNTGDNDFKKPEELGLDNGEITDQDLREKLKVGLAFFLFNYDHGGSCRWDVSRLDRLKVDSSTDGLLVWEHKADEIGGKTYEERRKDSEGFLEMYTAWCNGECYYYSIERPCKTCGQDNEVLDTCGGYYDIEDAKEQATEAADAFAEEIKKSAKPESKKSNKTEEAPS